jgi:hypothetical protein
MPIKVKDPTSTANKWDTNAGNATASYQAGIAAPKQSQSGAAIAAVSRWQASVQDPGAAARFTGHLQKAGDGAWSAGALGKGKDRYAGGIHAAKQKYLANVSPFLQAIAGVTLPDKGLRGSAQNYARVQAVGDALHALKISRAGQ